MSNAMQLTILQYDAEINDLEASILKDSMSKNLKHKQSSSLMVEIRNKFSKEIQNIRNKISALTGTDTNAEYRELMAEIEELKDDEDRELAKVEQESTDYENTIQLRIDNDQTRLEALRADNEQLKETNSQNTQKEFTYFK